MSSFEDGAIYWSNTPSKLISSYSTFKGLQWLILAFISNTMHAIWCRPLKDYARIVRLASGLLQLRNHMWEIPSRVWTFVFMFGYQFMTSGWVDVADYWWLFRCQCIRIEISTWFWQALSSSVWNKRYQILDIMHIFFASYFRVEVRFSLRKGTIKKSVKFCA